MEQVGKQSLNNEKGMKKTEKHDNEKKTKHIYLVLFHVHNINKLPAAISTSCPLFNHAMGSMASITNIQYLKLINFTLTI